MKRPITLEGVQLLTGNYLNNRRMLLVAPPVYDYRLEWPRWHQPTGLLQLGAWLRNQQKDVRLIDCLATPRNSRLPRLKLAAHEIDGKRFDSWHFGLSFEDLRERIQQSIADKWRPDTVIVTTLNSIWWEGARDTTRVVKEVLPKAKVVLGGAYPTVEPTHAAQYSGADILVSGSIPRVSKMAPDLSLYAEAPYTAGIYFYSANSLYPSARLPRPRTASAIVKEVQKKIALGVREFVFFDGEIRLEDRDRFEALLDQLAKIDLDNSHFVLPGNVSPRLINQPLARKLKRARVTQVFLRCDLRFGPDKIEYTTSLADYDRCVNALVKAGDFAARTDNLAAMLVVGLPYEDLDAVSERLIRLAHIVGSVMLVPFQYVPGLHTGPLFERALAQNGSFAPEKFNSKTFPLARLSGKRLEDYLELSRLAALLNSKYRSTTFDFLGDSLAAQLFRESLRTQGWNPFRDTNERFESSDLSLIASGEAGTV